MENKRQTAVDWLRTVVVPMMGSLTPKELNTMFDVAKSLERAQVVKAWEAGESNAMDCMAEDVDAGAFYADDYYRKTYE